MNSTMAHLDHSENSEFEGQEFVFEEENITPHKSEKGPDLIQQESVATSSTSVTSNFDQKIPEIFEDLQVVHSDEKRPRLEISENQQESENISSTDISENHSSYEYSENTSGLVSYEK